MSPTKVVAYLEAPLLSVHVKYSDYLQEFKHFLDFLRNNEDVASAQTCKRPVQPTIESINKTMDRLPVKKPSAPLLATSNEAIGSDVEAVIVSRPSDKLLRAPSPASVTDEELGPKAKPLPVDEISRKVLRQHAKKDMPKQLVQPPTDRGAAEQVGKRAAKATLRASCSNALTDTLIDTNRISRRPEDLKAIAKHMENMSRAAGRKLEVGDMRIRQLNKPPPPPGKTEIVDYAALWDATSDEGTTSD